MQRAGKINYDITVAAVTSPPPLYVTSQEPLPGIVSFASYLEN